MKRLSILSALFLSAILVSCKFSTEVDDHLRVSTNLHHNISTSYDFQFMVDSTKFVHTDSSVTLDLWGHDQNGLGVNPGGQLHLYVLVTNPNDTVFTPTGFYYDNQRESSYQILPKYSSVTITKLQPFVASVVLTMENFPQAQTGYTWQGTIAE